MTITTAITWTDSRAGGGESGSAGGISLFSISYHTQRDQPTWLMRSALPGYTGKTWGNDERDVLKAQAEQLLASWVARVSAPETTTEQQ